MAAHVSSTAYFKEDTIAAIVTALGGAISVIRLSGPASFAALEKLTRSKSTAQAEPRKLFRTTLHTTSGEPLDDVLFARFIAPESYTGEDVVELNLHGSPYIAIKILETLAEAGVRQALPGEFSFRAVRNGKISLNQATAIADLISASNDSAIALALEKLSGSQNRLLSEIAEGLRSLAMLSEAGIDFSDQDIDELGLARLRSSLEPLLAQLKALKSSFQRGSRIQEGVGVAFVGLPNAGKSSFFNALLGEDRSIVSAHAGTTRDIIREKLTLRGHRGTVTLRLEDTAGLRHSEDEIERAGITRTLRAASAADLILLIVDASGVRSELPAITEQWRSLGAPATKSLGILTKIDLLTPAELASAQAALSTLGIQTWVVTSAHTGEGIPAAAQNIATACEAHTTRTHGECLITRLDQKEAISKTLDHLTRAQGATTNDLLASDLRQALHSLSLLIGETLPDDILGQIFSRFCIGK